MLSLRGRGKVCPGCGDRNTRLSTRRKRFDYFLMALLFLPYRCRTCGRRFWRFA
jgi:hypothetical protein